MLVLKIISPILILLLVLVQFYINDNLKCTNIVLYKRLTWCFIGIIIISILFSIVTTINDNNSARILQKSIDEQKSLLLSAESNANKRETVASNERTNLESKIDTLQSRLYPFIKLALDKYPDLPEDKALENLKTELENLESRTTKLEIQSEDRKLTDKQIETIYNIISTNKKGLIIISCIANNSESYSYAKQFYTLFKKADWNTEGINTYNIFTQPPKDLFLKVRRRENTPLHMETLGKVFASLNKKVGIKIDPSLSENAIELIIAFK